MSVGPNHVHMPVIEPEITSRRLPIAAHKGIPALRQLLGDELRHRCFEFLVEFEPFLSVIPDSFVIQRSIGLRFQIASPIQHGPSREHVPDIRTVAVAKIRLASVRLDDRQRGGVHTV
ncbi:hypothetical protein D3C81_1399800 [compost metagenome]